LLARTPTSFRDKSKRKENGGVLAISLSFSLSLLLSFSLFLSFSLVLSLSLTHFFWREIGLKASIFSMKNVLSPLIVWGLPTTKKSADGYFTENESVKALLLSRVDKLQKIEDLGFYLPALIPFWELIVMSKTNGKVYQKHPILGHLATPRLTVSFGRDSVSADLCPPRFKRKIIQLVEWTRPRWIKQSSSCTWVVGFDACVS
jgi:hypothetical protein